jgi:dTDP-4-amino-4,6-dideoxygalactose transaminase
VIEYENLGKVNASFVSEYRTAFDRVLQSGWFIRGAEVTAFEHEFAAYCGTSECVGVANGLDALFLSLKAFGFRAGSEVLVPSNTYIATILSIVNAGLTPVPVEPDIGTYTIDPSRIEDRITRKTVALVIVHLYGKMCDMDPVMSICASRRLKLIEDCAQAHGASYRGRRAGAFGDLNAFRFYPTKNLGCLGDGGAVTTNDPELAARVRSLGNYGSRTRYHNEVLGVNSRLDEIQAAFLRVKLRRLDEINGHKRFLAAAYRRGIGNGYSVPVVQEGFHDVHHVFNIRHPRRDELKQYLVEREIKTDIHYPLSPNKQPALKGVFEEPCPISEAIHETTLSLPISFFHAKEDVLAVCEALRDFSKTNGPGMRS